MSAAGIARIRAALFEEPQATEAATGPAREALPGTAGLLHRGQACLFFSDRGAGKTTAALILGAGLAAEGLLVFYFDRENGAALTRARLEAIVEANEWPDVLADRRLIGRHYPRLEREWDPEHFGEAIGGGGFKLVIYDSLREAISQLGGDPNSDADISRFLDLAVTPLSRRGIATLILDNTGHEAKDRPKGSGSKLDAIAQAYKVRTTEEFSPANLGRIEISCTRSRFGDVGRRWTMRVGAGTFEQPVARDEAPDVLAAREIEGRRQAFAEACREALRENAPQGRDALIQAARDRGVKGRTATLRAWLTAAAGDPESGLISTDAGYVLTPGPEPRGQGGATPFEDPLAPAPLSLKGGGRAAGPGPAVAGHPSENGRRDPAEVDRLIAVSEAADREAAELGLTAFDDGGWS